MAVKDRRKIWFLVMVLVFVVIFNVTLVGAINGWFGTGKVTIDKEYTCQCGDNCICSLDYDLLTVEEYEKMAEAGKSFVVFIDQGGCATADDLEGYADEYAGKHGIKIFRMVYEDVKESSLGDSVKYYPSVAIVSRGQPFVWLRADSDEDAPAYNSYEEFEKWMDSWVVENFS